MRDDFERQNQWAKYNVDSTSSYFMVKFNVKYLEYSLSRKRNPVCIFYMFLSLHNEDRDL